MKIRFAILLFTLFGMVSSFAQKSKKLTTIAPKEIFVSDLLSKMTLEEKIGSLIYQHPEILQPVKPTVLILPKRLKKEKLEGYSI